ncbi:MAG: glutamate synthase large subunit [Candidatus Tectomicrobia bacterium]|uniref:Glutamate synthase [NADPH] large chain n=1 Tax=Tectimicrobiota bacterium TaxID=2528274 RepID=A0A932GNL6_UNCTE|nr:glutamate synthase large subunit [Candidatus Tectomicrobia bacterium]
MWSYPNPRRKLLYNPEFEHDSCGVGFVANSSGQRSFEIVRQALGGVMNLTHRGAIDADTKTGDGAGILTQIPHRLFQREAEKLGCRLEQPEDLAVGMIFLPRQNREEQKFCRQVLEEVCQRRGLRKIGWRAVPTDPSVLGYKAASTRPEIQQLLVLRPQGASEAEFERTVYLARKEAERRIEEAKIGEFYVSSFSPRTLVYKGLLVAPHLPNFYSDLNDPDYESALAVFHQRYSTNTFPTWQLAQPFRALAHNGEINTLRGNRNWVRAREPELLSPVWGEEIHWLKPILQAGGSDSASLDNVLELLTVSGRELLEAMMTLVPEAWESMPRMNPRWRAFYEYQALFSESWDGPAALAFTDGNVVGACLDRNGLRPSRYKLTEDGTLVVASEVGVLEFDERRVMKKGRLGPGQMIAVDTRAGRLLTNDEIKNEFSSRRPYRELLEKTVHYFPAKAKEPISPIPSEEPYNLLELEKVFGYTREEISLVLTPMIDKKEPVGSMGDDTPIAVLSRRPRLLYSYLKQLFAQVTNPPIDPIREELVMSLHTYLGRRPNYLALNGENDGARLLHLSTPILTDQELEGIKKISDTGLAATTLDFLFPVNHGAGALESSIRDLCTRAIQAVLAGKTILILSDRGVNSSLAPIPMALAVGAVHHHLIRQGKRTQASLIAETGEAREVHHMAVLIGNGASAINPYLAWNLVDSLATSGAFPNLSREQALGNYRTTLNKGILKIMSKMGISTVSSYHGGQIFEAIGIGKEVIDLCLPGTPSAIGGLDFEEIAADVLRRHRDAYGDSDLLEYGGDYKYKHDGEYHSFNPHVVNALHKAIVDGSPEEYRHFADLVQSRNPMSIRDLLDIKKGTPIPLEEVEPVSEITRRFTSAAMSLGALGPEAHETLAIAMNRIGAKSNTGEGGEDHRRFHEVTPEGDSSNSKVKQVASGRFGVTPEYLVSAEELQIKMAQGSKPGEGGQLPGHKVVAHIAAIRNSIPGVTLISPPPHHDIYSIEDLAQLIYDLKQVNPRAKVSVKLVSEAGVGTIAAGVAKAYADLILISGHEGGTGASPLSSIKNAGCPWELGLAETQQVLMLNGLRGRVVLQTDGGLKTGRDVVFAALFGAEEYGFGSAVVVATGCRMARQCHMNTCPVGVATQDPKLREKFWGTPEMVVNYLTFVAQEVREILAEMGFRKLDEIIGRTDLLLPKDLSKYPKAQTLDLGPLLAQVDPEGERPRHHTQERNDRVDDEPLDVAIIRDAAAAIEGKGPVSLSYRIQNTNRTVGARLAGELAGRYGNAGLPEGSIRIHFQGSAGQSFGAFCVRGMELVLTGEANDYVGKGMNGGTIAVRPPEGVSYRSHENSIVGNTVLYGATGGSLFVAGQAGERFAVRNSGARTVVEGVGDHGCEYMTGGVVAILGTVGRNFGAGMSGGFAYVFDETGEFPELYNRELIQPERTSTPEDGEELRRLIEDHHRWTRSARARDLLDRWEEVLPLFWKVVPHSTEATAKATPKGVEALAAGRSMAGAHR